MTIIVDPSCLKIINRLLWRRYSLIPHLAHKDVHPPGKHLVHPVSSTLKPNVALWIPLIRFKFCALINSGFIYRLQLRFLFRRSSLDCTNLSDGLPVRLQVRVMVRICSSHSGESSESMSFLKVDGRKKQLTLIETSNGGNSAPSQRRSTASAPKTFTFDAVFTQDASQVGEAPKRSLMTPRLQSQSNSLP